MSLKLKQCFLGGQQKAFGNVSRAVFLFSQLLFKWNNSRSAQGHQGVEVHTCPGATQASGCFFLTRICQGFRCSALPLETWETIKQTKGLINAMKGKKLPEITLILQTEAKKNLS